MVRKAFLIIILVGMAFGQGLRQRTKDALMLLYSGEYKKLHKMMDTTLASALPHQRLEEVLRDLEKKVGMFQEIGKIDSMIVRNYVVIIAECKHQNATILAQLSFNNEGKISGIFFKPSRDESVAKWTPPSYADTSKFTEKSVSIGKKPWELPGVLSVPKGCKSCPAVVLVHGSGPQDKDESLGGCKPFKDLAWGLASNGIAVLRYEKRTRHYASQLAPVADSITPYEETVEDALAGVEFLRTTKGINKKKIYVIGHSLGAMMAPEIARLAANKLAGIILLAPIGRALEDVILEQTEYIASLQEDTSGEAESDISIQLEELRSQVKLVKSGPPPNTKSSQLPLGIPVKYWQYLKKYNAIETASKLRIPILILHGGRDYQVVDKDIRIWQMALGERKNCKFIEYPSLNHLFCPGKGKSHPDEYNKPNNVDESVIADIVQFIKGE